MHWPARASRSARTTGPAWTRTEARARSAESRTSAWAARAGGTARTLKDWPARRLAGRRGRCGVRWPRTGLRHNHSTHRCRRLSRCSCFNYRGWRWRCGCGRSNRGLRLRWRRLHAGAGRSRGRTRHHHALRWGCAAGDRGALSRRLAGTNRRTCHHGRSLPCLGHDAARIGGGCIRRTWLRNAQCRHDRRGPRIAGWQRSRCGRRDRALCRTFRRRRHGRSRGRSRRTSHNRLCRRRDYRTHRWCDHRVCRGN